MSYNRIPSEMDFARARLAMRKWDQGLSEVRAKILEGFSKEGLHEVFVFYSPGNHLFVIHLFYQQDNQIDAAEKSGLTNRIRSAVIEELERVGRGERSSIQVQVSVDSHENVEKNFNGNYFLRLR